MVKRQRQNWLCRLRLHKWRNFGEPVVITWKEPGLIVPSSHITQTRTVLTEKECLRCGIRMKRRLINNPDGTLSCIGWDPIPEPGYMKKNMIRE